MMAPMSVNGYSTQMLATTGREVFAYDERKDVVKPKYHELSPGSMSCPLLAVPPEIRFMIYSYALPTTMDHQDYADRVTAWLRGSIAILAANKQIYHEAIEIMYGANTFSIDVGYKTINFAYQWLLPCGRAPRTTIAFLDLVAKRNIALIRNCLIRVHMVDSYAGMIKYNVTSLSHLAKGVQRQALKLVESLQTGRVISRLHIHLVINEYNPELYPYGDKALLPFLDLRNVSAFFLSGRITPDFQARLGDQSSTATVTSVAHEFCTSYESHGGILRSLNSCCTHGG